MHSVLLFPKTFHSNSEYPFTNLVLMLISHQSGSKSALFVLFFLKSMPFQRKLTSICLSLGSETISLLHCPNHPRHSPKHTSFAPFIRCYWATGHKLPPHTHFPPLLWVGAYTLFPYCPIFTLSGKKTVKSMLIRAIFGQCTAIFICTPNIGEAHPKPKSAPPV